MSLLNNRNQSKHRLLFNWFMKLSHLVDSDAHAMEEPQERKSNEAKGISGKQRIHLMRKIKQPRQQRRENGLKSHLIM